MLWGGIQGEGEIPPRGRELPPGPPRSPGMAAPVWRARHVPPAPSSDPKIKENPPGQRGGR